MSVEVSNYPRIEFVVEGTPRVELSPHDIQERFEEAILIANGLLDEVVVCYVGQIPYEPLTQYLDPERNILLGVRVEGGSEPIDIIDLKGLDETTIKPAEALAEEIVLKVRQHLIAKETDGIFISTMGAKFDPRFLKGHTFGCDPEGYLVLDECRLLYPQGEKWRVIKAEIFHSNTICRLVEEGDVVRWFDDYDLVRKNNRGMFVNWGARMWIPKAQLLEEFQAEAAAYEKDYVLLERDEQTPELKKRLIALYRQFPVLP